jgi:hypothetical protein
MPNGWFDRNKVSYVRAVKRLGPTRAGPSGRYVSSEDLPEQYRMNAFDRLRQQSREESVAQTPDVHPYDFLAAPIVRPQVEVRKRFIESEARVRLARVACALERYRLAEGRYPDKLALLAPKFIAAVPPDVIDGGELKYRRTEDDGFVLYSIGWNGKDDGGEVVFLTRQRWVDESQGDWVWKSSPE